MAAMRHPLAILTLAALCLPAAAVDLQQHGTGARCVAGSCTTGQGTIRHEDGNEYTGHWTDGRFTGGTAYQVRYSFAPTRSTELVFGADGSPVSGTALRGNPHTGTGVVGEFSGSFTMVRNPFLNREVSTYHVGKYTDKLGRVYDGEFSYVPSRGQGLPTGTFIFQGVRIDADSDEVVRGLFISDPAPAGFAILFRRARPDYLVKLQRDFAQEQVSAAADARVAAQAAEDDRQASNNMASLLGVMGGLLSMGGGGKFGSLQSSSLAALTGGLGGKQSSSAILSGVLSQVIQHAGNDAGLARTIGDPSNPAAIISTLTGLGKSGQSMTRAQYAAQLLAAASGGSGASGNHVQGTGSAVMDALGQATINRTSNTIASALGGSGNAGARTGVALLQQAANAMASAPAATAATVSAPGAGTGSPTPAGSTSYGTVQLHYTPGKGFRDPVTGAYIRVMEDMSCDNVTTTGWKLRDLPPDQRVCVDKRKSTAQQ